MKDAAWTISGPGRVRFHVVGRPKLPSWVSLEHTAHDWVLEEVCENLEKGRRTDGFLRRWLKPQKMEKKHADDKDIKRGKKSLYLNWNICCRGSARNRKLLWCCG